LQRADTVEKLLTDQATSAGSRQVLWIDEAGLLSTHDMKRVFDLARRENCRVVLAGDIRQHGAVAVAMRCGFWTGSRMKFAELKQVAAGRSAKDYRDAVTAISQGRYSRGDGRTGSKPASKR